MNFEKFGATIERDLGADLGRVAESTVEVLRDLPEDESGVYLDLVRSLNAFLEPKS